MRAFSTELLSNPFLNVFSDCFMWIRCMSPTIQVCIFSQIVSIFLYYFHIGRWKMAVCSLTFQNLLPPPQFIMNKGTFFLMLLPMKTRKRCPRHYTTWIWCILTIKTLHVNFGNLFTWVCWWHNRLFMSILFQIFVETTKNEEMLSRLIFFLHFRRCRCT